MLAYDHHLALTTWISRTRQAHALSTVLDLMQKVGRTAQPESPRLDDFAHMGLITELLE
jgi:hypothetical protein